jgi:hypothetical protein
MQVAVVELVFLDDIVLQAVQVFIGEKLPGEEAGAAQAYETAAFRAGRQWRAFFRPCRLRHACGLIKIVVHVSPPVVVPCLIC